MDKMKGKLLPLRVAIANATPFYKEKEKVWLPSTEWKSLEQWIDFLGEVTLLKPEVTLERCPKGWLEVPSDIKVKRLCFHKDSFFRRRHSAIIVAKDVLRKHDILYARMPNYEAYWCYQVAKKIGIPMFTEIHGDWETAVRAEDTRSFLRVITRLYRANRARQAVLEMGKEAFCALAVGPQLLDKYIPEDIPRLVSTNNLLSVKFYNRREKFSLNSPPQIFFAGDVQRRKGLHVLFRALAILKDSGRDFEMIIAGSGPQIGELELFASQYRFRRKVNFLGRIPYNDELYKYYQRADVFVLPSIAAEGVPRVTHEAMAFGCPVIATDIGSVRWQLRDGAGIIVPPGNPEVLANAIERVLTCEDLRRELSNKGYSRSLEYTLENQKDSIAAFMVKYLSRRKTAKSIGEKL